MFKYLLFKNFLDVEDVDIIYKHTKSAKQSDDPSWASPNTKTWHGISEIDKICSKYTDKFSALVLKNLVPTNAYLREYLKGTRLYTHTDKNHCEYSITIHIHSSNPHIPYPIYVVSRKGDRIFGKTNFNLKVGDALCYHGIDVPHGREVCPVDSYIQVFFHYVDRDGKYFNDPNTRFFI